MGGLARICKLYGSMMINGKRYVWDYANDEAVPEDEMPIGSGRRAASDRALGDLLAQSERGTSRDDIPQCLQEKK